MDHHAYTYEGSMGEFEALKEEIKPFVAQKFERFGIDDARNLVDQAALKREGESLYLIAASSITTEAQQALLKLFEEPRAGVAFVLLVPHGSLLPTLMSRMLEYPQQNLSKKSSGLPSRDSLFGESSRARLFSKDLAALIKEKEIDKDEVRDFLNTLEVELSKDIKKNRQALEDIAMVRDYMRDRSPSMKMLLEHLSLSLVK